MAVKWIWDLGWLYADVALWSFPWSSYFVTYTCPSAPWQAPPVSMVFPRLALRVSFLCIPLATGHRPLPRDLHKNCRFMYACWQAHTTAVTPGSGFVTHCFKADDSREGMLCGRLSCREKVQGQWVSVFLLFHAGYHAENFQAGSKVWGDLILVLISPQSGPTICENEASCLSQILLQLDRKTE